MDIWATTTQMVVNTINREIELIQVLRNGMTEPHIDSPLLSICESISVASYQIRQALLHHQDIGHIATSNGSYSSNTFHTTLESCQSIFTTLHGLLVKYQSLKDDVERVSFEAAEAVPTLTIITLSLTNISTSLTLLLQGLQL
jgi:hypothetical protein